MSMLIFRVARPQNIQNWVATNSPASVRADPNQSWRAYLATLGATGQSIKELERSVGSTLTASLTAAPTRGEAIRATYK